MNDQEFMQKLREAFAIEADEHLQAMTAGLLALEKAPSTGARAELTGSIFREAHSLKGAARAVNRLDIEAVCQALESVFAQWERGGPPAQTESFDALNAAVDFLGVIRTQAEADRGAVQETVRAINRLLGPSRVGAEAAPPVAREPLAASAQTAPALPPKPAPEPSAAAGAANSAETVRVPMTKLDALLRRAEELVALKQAARHHAAELRGLTASVESWRKTWRNVRAASGAGAGTAVAKLHESEDWNGGEIDALEKRAATLTKSAERHERAVDVLVEDLLEAAKDMIMLPFARLLSVFPKQVRDLAREQGKEIEFSIRGGEIEIDKRILEEMKAPLLHLVRNAIDHGLEMPDERTRRGKSPQGRLAIDVSQRESGRILIVVRDDGAGIDLARVRAAAVASGAATDEDTAQLSEPDALALIFRSGVSTSPLLTEISGRGLGMAIVRETVAELGGQIAIESQPGLGTAFHITLPITIANFRGVLLRSGGQTFVLPTKSIEHLIRVRLEELQTVENRETIIFEQRAVAVAWLADVLGLPRVAAAEARSFVEAVVIGPIDQRVAFVVEAFEGEVEVLAKALPSPLLRVRHFAGVTALASGTPALILHPGDLLESAVRLAAAGGVQPTRDPAGKASAGARRVLVADDSVTSRMLLKNILETAGYEVTTAVDGLEAWTTLRAGDFALLVSDVEMPRLDGFGLTAKLRAEKQYADLPVILVTALSSREDQERGIDVGANAYLVKSSFDQSNLLEVIGRLL